MSGDKKPQKIAVVGGPGSGKSTLAIDLAAHLKHRLHDVRLVQEYPSDYIHQCGPPAIFWEQIDIFYGQREKEHVYERLVPPPEFIVCDYAAFVAFIYFMVPYRPAPDSDPELLRKYAYHYGKLEALARENARTYRHIFLANAAELPYIKDGTRFQRDREEGLKIDRALKQWMDMVGIAYHEIGGNADERLAKALAILGI